MVKRATNKAEDLPAADTSRRDRGTSFIELLVAIVLLGTVVIAVLTAVRVTVIATTTEREHSRAEQWLESAAEELEITPFGNCNVSLGVAASAAAAHASYEAAVEGAPVPAGWDPSQISVATEIYVWDGSSWVLYATAGSCLDDLGLTLQRVSLTVENPDGKIIETRRSSSVVRPTSYRSDGFTLVEVHRGRDPARLHRDGDCRHVYRHRPNQPLERGTCR